MKLGTIRLLIIVFTMGCFPAMAQEEIYLIVNNRIIRVIYYDHELQKLTQLINSDGNVMETNERPEEGKRYRHYPSVQSFLVDYNEGLLIWSPPSSPLHGNLNSLQSVAQAVPEAFIPRTYPIICIQHFHHGECNYPRCRLTHLTPEQRLAVRQLPNFHNNDDIHRVICVRFSRGECEDNNCQGLHIHFDPNKVWQPRYE